jgi:hypothetical protein
LDSLSSQAIKLECLIDWWQRNVDRSKRDSIHGRGWL